MSDFTAQNVLDYDAPLNLPEVTDEHARAALIAALEEELSKGWNDAVVRFGAVWERKGYPVTGSISDKVDARPYRSPTDRSDAMILVAIVVPEYLRTDATKSAIPIIAAADEKADAEAKEAARQTMLDKAATLRAEAEKLEAQAGA